MRERCFDELARRAPAGPEDDLDGHRRLRGASPPTARSRRCAPPTATSLLLRDVHGLDSALLCAVTDMSEADVENQLYRARAEFASRYALAAGRRSAAARAARDCPDCAERERLRALPQHALLHLGPLAVRDQVRAALRTALSGASAADTRGGVHRREQPALRRPCRASR